MIKNRRSLFIGILVSVVIIFFIVGRMKRGPSNEITQEIKPAAGDIQATIISTATVQPQNRLEIKPSINGRIEEILVKEGDGVKAGQVLVWMSSTERAALLDSAREQGPEIVKYWKDVYKPTPLISPIDGQVIVSKDYPGQTVTTADAVIVLSDHLIVQAQVDETDIGRVKLGQTAAVSLDAYPEIKISGKVNHIYYESLVVNNVTIYQVDILPDKVPGVFRSGMSATVDIIVEEKKGALTVPLAAIKRGKDGPYVILSRGHGRPGEERKVETGIADEKNAEIISGLSTGDKILITVQKYKANTAARNGSNPLNPMGRRR